MIGGKEVEESELALGFFEFTFHFEFLLGQLEFELEAFTFLKFEACFFEGIGFGGEHGGFEFGPDETVCEMGLGLCGVNAEDSDEGRMNGDAAFGQQLARESSQAHERHGRIGFPV